MLFLKFGDRDISDHDVGKVLESARFQFAKTMPEVPHSYTMSKWWEGNEEPSFSEVARFIYVIGKPRKWGPHRNTYLDFGGYSYWGMDAKWEDVTLINRCTAGWVDPMPMVRIRKR